MAHVRLYMTRPRPDGLSSQDEYPRLCQLEDELTVKLTSNDVGYVGRNTSDGCRDFYFYVADPERWDERVAAALSSFAEYKFDTGTREDPEWTTYRSFLMPGAWDRDLIQSRRVCAALERQGDALTAAREIDHWTYFPSEAAMNDFVIEALALGFSMRKTAVDQTIPPRFCARVTGVDSPSLQNISEMTYPLFEAARRHGGEYDGWECPVVA